MNNELLEVISDNIDALFENGALNGRFICVFGMNSPGDFIIRYLDEKGLAVNVVLDNNPANSGLLLEGVCVSAPETALPVFRNDALILICSKYYSEMRRQLERMGYVNGIHIFKALDMASGAVLTLDKSVFDKMAAEALEGAELAERILSAHGAETLLVLPVKANGDAYVACSFLRAYLDKNGIEKYVLALVGKACVGVAEMFGLCNVYAAKQVEIERLSAAHRVLADSGRIKVLQPYWGYAGFLQRLDCFKGLSFVDFYRGWVFGLDTTVRPETPRSVCAFEYGGMVKGKTVVLSPYANSLAGVPLELFERLAAELKAMGYAVATNVAGNDAPIAGTIPLFVPICGFIDAVEYAGAFIGIRNGLCDILSMAHCKRAVIYPNKSYAFGTARELYGLSELSDSPLLELTFDGELWECANRIVKYVLECEEA